MIKYRNWEQMREEFGGIELMTSQQAMQYLGIKTTRFLQLRKQFNIEPLAIYKSANVFAKRDIEVLAAFR